MKSSIIDTKLELKTDQEERLRDTILNLHSKGNLEAGKVTSSDQLLEAMAPCGDAENDLVIDRIVKAMKKGIKLQ